MSKEKVIFDGRYSLFFWGIVCITIGISQKILDFQLSTEAQIVLLAILIVLVVTGGIRITSTPISE